MDRLIVTIDGPAGVGKSTIAQNLAMKLGVAFLDTGAMYRAVTLACIQKNADLQDVQSLLKVLDETEFGFSISRGDMAVSIDGQDSDLQIRDPKITSQVKYIASQEKLRDKLVLMQRNIARLNPRLVTEGRDQGTVVFPDAEYKFFLTADAAERARRRKNQLGTKAEHLTVQEIQDAIEKRDYSDQNRKVGALKPAEDAIIIDSSDLSIDQVIESMMKTINKM